MRSIKHILICCTFIFSLIGCAVYTNTKLIKNNKIKKPINVIIKPSVNNFYGRKNHYWLFREALQSSGYFVINSAIESEIQPSYAIHIKEGFRNILNNKKCDLGMHLITLYTLGAYPAQCNYRFYSSYTVENLITSEKFDFKYEHSSKKIMGWLAVLLRILPNFSYPYDYEKYYQNVTSEIYMMIENKNL